MGDVMSFKEKLMSGFPPATLIGVDIGSATLKIVELRMMPSQSLSFFSITEIPHDRSDTYITETVSKILSEAKSQAKKAVLTFTDSSVIIKRLELPIVTSDEIENAIKWQFKDLLSYDIDRACIDYEFIREYQKDDGSKVMEFIAAIAPRDIIDQHIKSLRNAGLEVLAVSLAPFGLENIVKGYEGESAASTIAIADVGCSKTAISIFDNKRLQLVRSVSASSSDISEALTGTLVGDKGTISLTKPEAEALKTGTGVPYDTSLAGAKISSIQIMSLIRPVLERIASEIGRSANYYVQQYGGKNISVIYLAGAGSRLKNLARFISEELKVAVKAIEIPKSVNTSKVELSREDILPLASLIGAVSGYKNGPNLLPYENKVEKIEFVQGLAIKMAVVIAGLILATSFVFTNMEIESYKHRLKEVRFQKENLTKIKERQTLVDEREALLKQIQAVEVMPAPVMKEISRILPSNVMLDWVTIDIVAKNMDMGGTVTGAKGSGEATLTKFMQDMQSSQYFKEAQLTSIQEAEDPKTPKSRFEINCLFE